MAGEPEAHVPLSHLLPSLRRSHERTVDSAAIAQLVIELEEALGAGLPAELVLESEDRSGSEARPAIAAAARDELAAGRTLDDVLAGWTRRLERHWGHLVCRAAEPGAEAASAVRLRAFAQWGRRVLACLELERRYSIQNASTRLTVYIASGAPGAALAIVSLINPNLVKSFFPGLMAGYAIYLLACGLLFWSAGRRIRASSARAHPLGAFLAAIAAHLDAGATPGEAFARAQVALDGAPCDTVSALVRMLRSRGIPDQPLMPVALLLVAPAQLSGSARGTAVEFLCKRALELERARMETAVSGTEERYVLGGAIGAAALAALVAALLWQMLGPLL